MPRIDAPTVAEHHARRRAALVRAATDIMVAEGAAAVTPAAVGAAAGLARSSVYQYFPSTGALLGAVVEEAFPAANAALRESTATARAPLDRIDAYVRTAIELSSAGIHRAAEAIARAEMPESFRDRLRALHVEQGAPLLDAVRDLGDPAPEVTTALLGGLIAAATRAIAAGAPADVVIRRTLALVREGIGPGR